MINEPLVTVITPCYNHEDFLEDYFTSILEQTYENIELVIFDDASKDKSQEIIEEWLHRLGKRFKRVVYVPREKNVGVVRNCNEGLELANGEYICLFASDDIMMPTKIAENVSLLERNPKYGMVYGNVTTLKKGKISKKPMFKHEMPNGDIFIDLLAKNNYIPAPSVCIRKDVINRVGNYNEDLNAEDYQMWLKISERYEVGYIHKPLAIYRLSSSSLCNSRNYKIEGMDGWLNFKKSFFKSEKVNEEVIKNVLENTYSNYAKRAFYFNDRDKFKEYYNYYLDLNKNSGSNCILKIFNYISNYTFIYKIIIIMANIFRYFTFTSVKTLNKNIKDLIKE